MDNTLWTILRNQQVMMRALREIGTANCGTAFNRIYSQLDVAIEDAGSIVDAASQDEAPGLTERERAFRSFRGGGQIDPTELKAAMPVGPDGVRHVHFHPPEGSVLTQLGDAVRIVPAAFMTARDIRRAVDDDGARIAWPPSEDLLQKAVKTIEVCVPALPTAEAVVLLRSIIVALSPDPKDT